MNERMVVWAAAAWDGGIFAREVVPVPVPPDYADTALRDNNVRWDSSLEQMAKLPPVFDRKYGTVTAALINMMNERMVVWAAAAWDASRRAR